MPWDQTAYWAMQIGINLVGTVPLIGDLLSRVLRRGETLGALTLSRFCAIHVLFLPALLLAGIALHLFVLWRVGPAGPWTDDRASLSSETFAPRQVYMDAVVMAALFLVLGTLASTIPLPLTDKANPSDTNFVPVPEWYFLFYYELPKYVHGPLEPLATWVLPLCVILIMLFWPFIDRNPIRNPIRRPAAIGSGLLFLLVVFGLLGISIKNLYAVPRTDPSVARGKAGYVQFGCAGLPPRSWRGRSGGARAFLWSGRRDSIENGTSNIAVTLNRCLRGRSCRNSHSRTNNSTIWPVIC